jgi:hypothetical protein
MTVYRGGHHFAQYPSGSSKDAGSPDGREFPALPNHIALDALVSERAKLRTVTSKDTAA